MTERNRSASVQNEKAILVGVLLDSKKSPHDALGELTGLAETAGAVVEAGLVNVELLRIKQPTSVKARFMNYQG